jgi:two-component system nitrogen regulation sensor histidine kinase NtrY
LAFIRATYFSKHSFNLIKNSLEALEDQDPPRIITLSTQHTEVDEIVLRIKDNGPGIEESLLPELFDPYVSNKAKGSGLGLAIVKKIIEDHGGRIYTIDSNTFVIELPV